MSDNSMEVVESNASEPGVDVKQTEEVVETKTEEPEADNADGYEVEEETDAEPEKKLTKAEQVELDYKKKLEKQQVEFKKRIDRKTAAEKQALEERQKLQKQLKELQSKVPAIDDAPKEEDYDSFDDFVEDTTKHKAEKLVQERLAEAKRDELQLAQQREFERRMKEFQEKEQNFRTENPDYDKNSELFNEQVEYLKQVYPQNQSLQYASEMLLSSEVAPALINELGKNPDLAEEWASLNPVQAAREVFKLEAELSKPKQFETNPLPKPIKSVKSSGTSSKSINKMTTQELMKWVSS